MKWIGEQASSIYNETDGADFSVKGILAEVCKFGPI